MQAALQSVKAIFFEVPLKRKTIHSDTRAKACPTTIVRSYS